MRAGQGATQAAATSVRPTDSAVASWLAGRRKGLVERVAAAALVVPSAFALLPLAVWSALSFKANPIFLQRRVGLGGKPFGMFKLRTLPVSTPTDLDREQLEEEHPASGFANFLRASHLDELPQIWHVVSGKMSLVGPRPMIESIVDGLDSDFRRFREAAKPGLTGLWQISVCGAERFERYDALDVAYIQTATPKLDVKIIYWTVRQIFGAKRLTAAKIEESLSVTLGTSDELAGAFGDDASALEPSLRRA